MQPIFILNTCDQHKSHASAKPLFYYNDSAKDVKKILNYIKNNLETFFDGDETYRKQQFAAFKNLIEYKQGSINEALNSDANIYASSTELEHISKLKSMQQSTLVYDLKIYNLVPVPLKNVDFQNVFIMSGNSVLFSFITSKREYKTRIENKAFDILHENFYINPYTQIKEQCKQK